MYTDLVKSFINDLHRFNEDVTFSSTSKDMQFMFDEHKKHLNNLNVELDYDIENRGHFADKPFKSKTWKDNKYTSDLLVNSIMLNKKFSRDGKMLKEIKDKHLIWSTVSSYNKAEAISSDTYECPKCGAISTISELINGCPYCRTYFKMSELYPKVTSYVLGLDVGGTKKEVNSEIKKYIAVMWLASSFLFYMFAPELNLFTSILGGGIFGVVSGYLLWCVVALFRVFTEAGKSIKYVSNIGNSAKKFTNIMRKYTPEFSWEYFCNKVVVMLCTYLYCDNIHTLPFLDYKCTKKDNSILECIYTGSVGIKDLKIKDGYCYVKVRVYLKNTLLTEFAKVVSEDTCYVVDLKRNISKPVNLHFTMKAFSCNSCGASFDTTKTKFCPHCKTQVFYEDADWLITNIQEGFN